MKIINETIKIHRGVAADWLNWMKTEQLVEMKATGLVKELRIIEVNHDDPDDAETYAVHLGFSSEEDFNRFANEHYPAFIEKQKKRFHQQYVNFKTILDVLVAL